MKLRCFSGALVLVAGFPALTRGAEFCVDPVQGSPSNDGSCASPWSTLEEVIAAQKFGSTVKPGDTVWLRSGYHGEAVFKGGAYDPPIIVAAAQGATPKLRRVAFQGTRGWVLSGVLVSPSFAPSPTKTTMVSIDGGSANIEVKGCTMYSVEDASGWSADQWINEASSGVYVGGDDVTIRDCVIRNVRFGISVDGQRALIHGNRIVNFSADGLRGLGDYGIFEYNEVRNIYVGDEDGDSNHDDGFQSWSVGSGGVGTGEVKGVVLRGNFFLSTDDPNRPFVTSMQGIGCFDGFFVDWIVENNVVITDHWHGISLYGMRGGRIVNNTVIDVNTVSPGPPWIMVTAHKDGTPSENVVVRNNIATDFSVSGTNITSDHNAEITMADLAQYFVNPAAHDLHLLETSPAVNAGSSELAPPIDRDGIPRPQGPAVDLGAYEWHDPSVVPIDAGVDAGSEDGGAGDAALADGSAQDGEAQDGRVSADGGGGSGDAGVGGGGTELGGRCGCAVPGQDGRTLLSLMLLLMVGWAIVGRVLTRRERRQH